MGQILYDLYVLVSVGVYSYNSDTPQSWKQTKLQQTACLLGCWWFHSVRWWTDLHCKLSMFNFAEKLLSSIMEWNLQFLQRWISELTEIGSSKLGTLDTEAIALCKPARSPGKPPQVVSGKTLTTWSTSAPRLSDNFLVSCVYVGCQGSSRHLEDGSYSPVRRCARVPRTQSCTVHRATTGGMRWQFVRIEWPELNKYYDVWWILCNPV